MKSGHGNFFEDFRVGQSIRHATPRTITAGDVALYTALYGARFAPQSSDTFARAVGYPAAPVDDLLVFHVVFGKSVPDISLNASANLGYAQCRFLKPVYPGDTLAARSQVIGLRQSSSGDRGIVYVRTTGANQHGDDVLDYVRWVMVAKRDKASPTPDPVVPILADRVDPSALAAAVPRIDTSAWDKVASGSPWGIADYQPGELIDHVDGTTIEEAVHQLATRLYQNTARVHFNADAAAKGTFGRRLVYGGVIMSIARALSFNGMGNAFHIAAINAGRHVAPCAAGDTIFASTEILECADIAGRTDVGAIRARLNATAVRPGSRTATSPDKSADAAVLVLELDAWLILPRF